MRRRAVPPSELPPADHFAGLIEEAGRRRAEVAKANTAYRLVDDAADGLPGVVVERYGDWAELSLFTDEARAVEGELAAALVGAGVRGVYVVHRVRGDLRRAPAGERSPSSPVAGEAAPGELVVREGDLEFEVALGRGLSAGLFTDQRENRALVRRLSRGARVLNLFAYTCSFTVAAAAGGAAETTSVDLSQRALRTGRRNLERNGLWGPSHRLLADDAVDVVARVRRRRETFDLVVLDPPSFGTRGRGTFSVERDLEQLAAGCIACLAAGGRMLAVTNHRDTTRLALASMLQRAAKQAARQIQSIRRLEAPADHPFRIHGDPRARSLLLSTGGAVTDRRTR